MSTIRLEHCLQVVQEDDFVSLLKRRTQGLPRHDRGACIEIARALVVAGHAREILEASDPKKRGRDLGYTLPGETAQPRYMNGLFYAVWNRSHWIGCRHFDVNNGKGAFYGIEDRRPGNVNRVGVTELITPSFHRWAFHFGDPNGGDKSLEISFI